MATKQTVIWTVLPNGWTSDASALRVSVFVSVRLETDEGAPKPALSLFPDMVGWPGRMQAASFSVQFNNGAAVPARRAGPAIEPDLWAALVSGTTFVRPYQPADQFIAKNIRSIPVQNVSAFLKSQYQSIATTSPNVLPPRDVVRQKLAPVSLYAPSAAPPAGPGSEHMGTLRPQTPQARRQTGPHPQVLDVQTFTQQLQPRAQVSAARDLKVLLPSNEISLQPHMVDALKSVSQDLNQHRAVPASATMTPAKDFLQTVMFHRPRVLDHIQPPPPNPPEVDFHQFLSALGNYPELMRRLGLVLDLEVSLSGGLPASGTIRLTPTWTPALSTNVDFCPFTAYVADKSSGHFMATPNPTSATTVNGLLKLSDESYSVHGYDVDGAALKTIYLSDHLQQTTAQTVQQGALTPGMVPPQGETATVAPGAVGGAQPRVMSAPAPMALTANQQQFAVAPASLRSAPASGKEAAEPVKPAAEGLPSLRSAGLSVAQAGRAVALARLLDRTAILNKGLAESPSAPPTLYAEDLMRGYRVDLWDSRSKSWHSLCSRKGTYTFLATSATREFEDEGWVQLAVTQSPEKETPQASDDLYLHESMFRWDGWSLSAPRPGKHLGLDNKPESSNGAAKLADQAQSQFKLATTFQASSGSLAKLRFGTDYRFRARVVDLAGNSLKLNEARPDDFSQATPAQTYRRFEPAVAPVTVMTRPGIVHCQEQPAVNPTSPGESLDRLVIRSNFDKTAADYSSVFGSMENFPDYPAAPERLVIPAKTSQIMAEHLGMFDQPDGTMKKDSATYEIIRTRADAALTVDPLSKCPTQTTLDVPYLPDPMAHGASLLLLDRKGNQLPGAFTPSFYPAGQSWPAAKGFRLRVVEGKDKIEWAWDESGRSLTVSLPKAEAATIRLSSQLGEDDSSKLSQMGLWGWIQEANPANKVPMQHMGLRGNLWILTPYRDIRLIHPVQQPLILPQFHSLSATRFLGATFSYVGDDQPMPIDGKSTQKVDILASWEEPVDDLTKTEPARITGQAHVFEYQLTPDNRDISQTLDITFAKEFAHHYSLLSGVPLSQFISEYPLAAVTAAPAPAMVTPPAGKQEKKKVQPQVTEPAARQALGAAPAVRLPSGFLMPPLPNRAGYNWRHEFGDTKYRKVAYQAVASGRFREFFPGETPDHKPVKFTRESATVNVDVPNSARPAIPKILYVIPVFGWDRKTSVQFEKSTTLEGVPIPNLKGTAEVSQRKGGGLRVYLERPWYSSGDGELLGVVVWPNPPARPPQANPETVSRELRVKPPEKKNAPKAGSLGLKAPALLGGMNLQMEVPEEMKHLVTQWGLDPIWVSSPVPDLPGAEHFRNPAKTGTGLTLQELEGRPEPTPGFYKVGVVGFQPEYDKDRQLWYCDFEMDPGLSYYPFVRLALVRYQPISVENAHLSKVALADLAQLGPNRTATFVWEPKNLKKFEIVVVGPAYRASGAGTGSSVVEVTVEANALGGDSEVGWAPVPNGTLQLRAQDAGNGQIMWRGEVNLDRIKPPKLEAVRLVVREYEQLMADDRGPRPPTAMVANANPAILARRLVYADVLKVPLVLR